MDLNNPIVLLVVGIVAIIILAAASDRGPNAVNKGPRSDLITTILFIVMFAGLFYVMFAYTNVPTNFMRHIGR